ncbi:DUF5018 domain-containing protein [Flagellimonas allohymeniacidonis]|uniref:DUF5018 domain-containing protein n=1 Tax=Flagellimonas allohymeniacidonis TaxID=2517819 RepID=A0A4Q8QFG2_9FLAO|nr:DUF5018 domain-containing protein [Allomuricauda hymeniacidonis]TAI48604.1 DUF5018 domain-containing protein [Allomuricauda hymeniacidonis]
MVIKNPALFAIFLLLFISCSTDTSDDAPPTGSDQNNISSFIISGVRGTINDQENIISLILPEGTDLTALTPSIGIPTGATINPESDEEGDFSNPVIYAVTAENGEVNAYTVIVDVNVYAFTVGGKSYELIREERTWADAAAFAVSRGGYLIEINDLAENQGVFVEILTNGNFVFENLQRAAVWMGGNDFETEGVWILDGDNDGSGPQFWEGDFNGMAVGGLFNNWGREPDGGEAQNALSMVLRDTPINNAGQWNDLDEVDDRLYFVIEFD